MRVRRIVCAAALVLISLGPASAQARIDRVEKTSVAVTMSDFKFALSKKAVPSGPVVFSLRNAGDVPHDFKIANRKSKSLNRGARGILSVTFRRAGRYPYLCTLPGHADAGMKGVLVVR